MTVDKFGHYYNQKYNSEIIKKNVSKTFGIILDKNNNLDIQDKRIKNVAPPSEGADAVNKDYLYSQINHIQEILKKGINNEIVNNRKEIKDLKRKIKEIYDVMSTNNLNLKYTYTIDNQNNGEKKDN